MEGFSCCDQFIAPSGKVKVIIYSCKAVPVRIWIIDSKKQSQYSKTHAKTCHQQRVMQKLDHYPASAQDQDIQDHLYFLRAKFFFPGDNKDQNHCQMEKGTVIHQSVPWSFHISG